jgi:hypothetical protein
MAQNPSVLKRRKELARLERRREKEAKRKQRKLEKAERIRRGETEPEIIWPSAFVD